MIVVTGATGKLGSQIVTELCSRLPADELAVSVRDPARASNLAVSGIRVRRGDYADPASLVQAFEGATQILLVSSNARASGRDAVAQHRTAIEAARAVGARRIVYTSHMGASAASAFPPMLDHAATEAMLAECGIAWTALRNGFYADTVPMLIRGAAEGGAIEAPEDGPVAWTDHSDLAAAAARILCDEGRFNGPTPPLTAEQAPTLADVASMLTEQLGRPVERRTISDDAQADRLVERGLPPAAIAITLGLYQAARRGEFARTDPAMRHLIRRALTPVADVIAQAREQ